MFTLTMESIDFEVTDVDAGLPFDVGVGPFLDEKVIPWKWSSDGRLAMTVASGLGCLSGGRLLVSRRDGGRMRSICALLR